jgi:hypothetical protein
MVPDLAGELGNAGNNISALPSREPPIDKHILAKHVRWGCEIRRHKAIFIFIF